LKSYKSPDADYIPKWQIKTGGEVLRFEINKLIISLCNEEDLLQQWNDCVVFRSYRKDDRTD
jgi:hypothetical protein